MNDLFKQILEAIGENPQREGLLKTPERAATSLMELTEGYRMDIKDILNGAIFSAEATDMVVVKAIDYYSLCEHHLLPFFGQCHIAYLPQGKILGLSKFARIVDMFAKRLQVQENLTQHIAECIMAHTNARGVAVSMTGEHLCMQMRGARNHNASMTTSCMLGAFKDNMEFRAEFYDQIKA
ncbi:MAG: GTP cyclohydrolase I FolE [Gammaproteobacteria bacterium CG11_big_fil_rev_8_21_14_0_20_46_22]|nr:MAG: GTP cyclohydrolase I FolE [Gammaproteobacteria bacterium CG12_big_fil_rev_8_21_14_0_65_46_12]PIR11408.1 MAG: GTP cyclohydrolase I FolE [Gammaproteobacteria bacterium CG11_big_fil_rev_8_21_14_0_20_46_22]